MLKYHLLMPQNSKHAHGEYLHYLSAGSHNASYRFNSVNALSIVTLHPQQALPTFQHTTATALIVLSNSLAVDHIEHHPHEILWNPKQISNNNNDQKDSQFIFLAGEHEWLKP